MLGAMPTSPEGKPSNTALKLPSGAAIKCAARSSTQCYAHPLASLRSIQLGIHQPLRGVSWCKHTAAGGSLLRAESWT